AWAVTALSGSRSAPGPIADDAGVLARGPGALEGQAGAGPDLLRVRDGAPGLRHHGVVAADDEVDGVGGAGQRGAQLRGHVVVGEPRLGLDLLDHGAERAELVDELVDDGPAGNHDGATLRRLS